MDETSLLESIIEKYGVNKVNTLTKYPSIHTYHELGERGSLQDSLVDGKSFSEVEKVYVTEKIDGTNARIVFLNGDYYIGSRDNFLYSKGDRIGNPALGIVEAIKPIADRMCEVLRDKDILVVLYGEVYGGNVGQNSKQYSPDRSVVGFRMFDSFKMDVSQVKSVLSMDNEKISYWREHDGQPFATVDNVKACADSIGIKTVPYLEVVHGFTIPTTLANTYEWLAQYSETDASLSDDSGNAEGAVLRTADRSLIRKVRFEDYNRTKKRGVF